MRPNVILGTIVLLVAAAVAFIGPLIPPADTGKVFVFALIISACGFMLLVPQGSGKS